MSPTSIDIFLWVDVFGILPMAYKGGGGKKSGGSGLEGRKLWRRMFSVI
jgi:hypothetical protein